ncbi:MAG: class II fumarate hydratase, partial [Candidatus Deferrimicrobiaceae bacterium]
MTRHRTEKDSMGEVRVPAKAYYGAQTQRAFENFPVSGVRMPLPVVHAAVMIKGFGADVNAGLELLDSSLAEAI